MKVALITGSTHGMGLAIAEKLGLEGITVIISSRKEENSLRAEQILKENNIKYDYFMCNFDIREQRLQLHEFIKNKYGKLDYLISTVSVRPFIGGALSISENEFDKIFKTNVKNTFFTIIDFLDLIKKGTDRSIVIVSSHSGYSPFPYLGVSSTSRTATFSMTKLLAEELAKFKIRVNCIAPGIIQTRMTSSNIFNKYAENNFLRRTAMPHEVAGLAALLCSTESSFITGEVISVNGGSRARL